MQLFPRRSAPAPARSTRHRSRQRRSLGFSVILVAAAGLTGADAGAVLPQPGLAAGQPHPLLLAVRAEVAPATPLEVPDEARYPGLLIWNLQSELRDLGIYIGPVDGQVDGELLAAIRQYQRSTGLPADGEPSERLLRHMRGGGSGMVLHERLERVRRQQQSVARDGLLQNAATRGLLEGPEPIVTESNDTVCFAAPRVDCLLHAAVASAARISDGERRDWLFGEIAMLQARAAMDDQALRTTRLVDDPRKIILALRRLAEAQAVRGELVLALETAAMVPDVRQRAEALAVIAATRQAAADSDGAVATLAVLRDEAAAVTDPATRAPLLMRLAVGRWRLGEKDVAETYVEEARMAAKRGDPEQVPIDQLWVAIAEGLVDMHRPNDALAALQRIEESWLRVPVLVKVAAARAEAGDHAAALDSARAIEQPRFRSVLLARLAAIADDQGHVRQAKGLLREARKVADDIAGEFPRSFAYAQIAETTARIDGATAALELAGKVNDPDLRARTLWAIARLRAEQGDSAGADTARQRADATAEKLGTGIERALARAAAAAYFGARGNPLAAQQALAACIDEAAALTSAWGRARALTAAAEALLAMNAPPAVQAQAN